MRLLLLHVCLVQANPIPIPISAGLSACSLRIATHPGRFSFFRTRDLSVAMLAGRCLRFFVATRQDRRGVTVFPTSVNIVVTLFHLLSTITFRDVTMRLLLCRVYGVQVRLTQKGTLVRLSADLDRILSHTALSYCHCPPSAATPCFWFRATLVVVSARRRG
eukprot:Pompholyxophrys_punicea_v1_NODE_28_length_5163_cov_5.731206.p5 type:complete len:162 gc:universal NODE_28_length_5163_cov_5.731206:4578-5063(+)